MVYGMIRGEQMLTVLLMIYPGVQLSVPSWYYIICVLMMIIQAVSTILRYKKVLKRIGLNGLMSIPNKNRN